MITKLNLTARYIPLTLYLGILYTYLLVANSSDDIFDFWYSMIDFPANLVNWTLAGLYVISFCVIIVVLHFFIIKFSFEGLNENIPQSDTWESIQMLIFFGSFLVPASIGILYSFDLISVTNYQYLLIIWIIFSFLPDFSYYFYWLAQ